MVLAESAPDTGPSRIGNTLPPPAVVVSYTAFPSNSVIGPAMPRWFMSATASEMLGYRLARPTVYVPAGIGAGVPGVKRTWRAGHLFDVSMPKFVSREPVIASM